jgi:hypothetical protein
MERQIDFSHGRLMLCGACTHRWVVDLAWVDRWERGEETCPRCGVSCEHEDSPRVTVDPDDPALDDRVTRLHWYHTSTQPDWPSGNYDPAACLSAQSRKMMGGDHRVREWAARQQAKALHVGTYEAAVHNMLRRIRDQACRGSQFYLYRVHLRPSVRVREGWLIDPSDFVGDVMLADVCPPGVDVARYLNYHEDPGGLSLALGRNAIDSVQQVAVPLPDSWDEDWVRDAVLALENSSDTVVPVTGRLGQFMRPSSERVDLGRELGAALASRLPVNLQDQFVSAAALLEGEHSVSWARRTSAIASLVVHPWRVLAALDQAGRRRLSPQPL